MLPAPPVGALHVTVLRRLTAAPIEDSDALDLLRQFAARFDPRAPFGVNDATMMGW